MILCLPVNLCLPVVFTDKGDPTPGGHVKYLHPLKSVTLYRGTKNTQLPHQIKNPNVKLIHSFLSQTILTLIDYLLALHVQIIKERIKSKAFF